MPPIYLHCLAALLLDLAHVKFSLMRARCQHGKGLLMQISPV